ncbi:MAG: hypothetical protein ACHP6H_04675, partial [Legionellales bacterium]
NNVTKYEQTALSEMQIGFNTVLAGGLVESAGTLVNAVDPKNIGNILIGAGQATAAIGQYMMSQASYYQSLASFALQQKDWQNNLNLANKDVDIATTGVSIATDGVKLASQELNISQMQSQNAKDSVNFLKTKFTNAALYAYMSQQLLNVYKFFLNQATATARLATRQLAFERQINFGNVIANSYFDSPSAGNSTNPNQSDFKGLTGSARLLKDIYILDDDAVNTDKRKLQMSKTISLNEIDPISFNQFRTTGIFAFKTTQNMFDEDFPGQYLRLLQSVSVSVIALVPPIQGIRATLRSLGPSTVIIGADQPQEVTIQRDPDMIALTSPINSTGTFTLQQQASPELYAPFENSGVAMNWVFEMPPYTNRMDYSSIADVQITINYTALYNDILRQQVLKRLGSSFSAKRGLSMKLFFPDAWYDLMNPALNAISRTFSFQLTSDNFPVNMDQFTIEGITMFFQTTPPAPGTTDSSIKVNSLNLTDDDGNVYSSAAEAISVNNAISTIFINGLNWLPLVAHSPFGTWQIEIDNLTTEGINKIIAEGRLQDIIIAVQYNAVLPPYYSF